MAHARGLQQIAWSPDGAFVVSGGEDGRIAWWNAANESPLRESAGGGFWVEHVGWSPDGQKLATGSGKHLRVWDCEGRLIHEWTSHASSISGLRWRGDSRAVGTSSYGLVQLFRLGETLPYEPLVMKTSFLCLAWSPNGRHVAAGTQENTVVYWRLPFRDREPLQMSGYAHKIKNLAWDYTSQWLATDGGEDICVWNVSGGGPAGKKPIQLQGHRAKVTCLAYQKRGDYLASGCADGAIRVWRPHRSKEGIEAARLESEITRLAWSPDEKNLLAAAADGTVRLIR
jgi:WD40 repeat protein